MTKEMIDAWNKQRAEDVTGPLGDLSLIAMHDLQNDVKIKEISGTWTPTTQNEPGLTLTATAEDELFIHNEPVIGTVEVIADETVVTTANGISAMATSQPGSLHLLAIWDENCDSVQSFDKIDTFAYNEKAIYTGKLMKDETLVQFSHTGDEALAARSHESIGVVEVMIEGVAYALRPFQSGPYSIVIFRDATSGSETYGMGRMIVLEMLDHDTVKLDFNKAFLPPCAFSPYFNCPMPPMSNRIQSKIEAGEKKIITK